MTSYVNEIDIHGTHRNFRRQQPIILITLEDGSTRIVTDLTAIIDPITAIEWSFSNNSISTNTPDNLDVTQLTEHFKLAQSTKHYEDTTDEDNNIITRSEPSSDPIKSVTLQYNKSHFDKPPEYYSKVEVYRGYFACSPETNQPDPPSYEVQLGWTQSGFFESMIIISSSIE
ncbi:Hypothetical protein HVR_LOCUS1327 [uncultured virus]|nr:Hypothetical protein HVR_LOCUS1327 [uncultured virus]